MNKAFIEIYRVKQDENQTSGICVVYDNERNPIFSSLSLERGWRNNEKNVSCVPSGTYELKYEYSNKFKKKLWELKGVKNRTECKFHSAKYWHHLEGCISLGFQYKYLNDDKYMDFEDSKDAMIVFEMVLKSFELVELTII